MAKIIKEVSVFLPAYNEEKHLKKTTLNVIKVLQRYAGKWEVIIVNDGSKDRTGEVAESLSKTYKNKVKVVHHNPNRGYGAALKSGFYGSRYEWVSFIDADGQFDFRELPKLIEKQKNTNADLVVGYYKKRAVPFYRKLNTFAWQVVVNILFDLNIKDIDCGFKLIRKEVIDAIPKLESERGAFISSELLIKAKKKSFKIVEIGVTHLPRLAGKGTGADLNVIIKSFVDLFRLWKKLR